MVVPDKPKNKTFLELVKLLKKYAPPELEVLERNKFYTRQEVGETVKDFITAALKEIAAGCDFI